MPRFIGQQRLATLERLEGILQSHVGKDQNLAEMDDSEISACLDSAASVSDAEGYRIGNEAVESVFSEAGVNLREGETYEAALGRLAAKAGRADALDAGLQQAGVTLPETVTAEAVKSTVAAAIDDGAVQTAANAGVPAQDAPDTPGEGDGEGGKRTSDAEHAKRYSELMEENRESATEYFAKHRDAILRGMAKS
jgi:hypothetical protein